MNDAQVDRLLEELSKTRESFDNANIVFTKAISSIKWNRFNTIVLYSLMGLIFLIGAITVANYVNDRRVACENRNDLRITVAQGMEANALAIGAALAIVFEAPQEELDKYLNAYNEQRAPESIQFEEC